MNEQLFWMPRVAEALRDDTSINCVWYLEDDISVAKDHTLEDFILEIHAGRNNKCSVQWLGFHKKGSRSSCGWVQGMGSNLVSFTGSGLQLAWDTLERRMGKSHCRWSHLNNKISSEKHRKSMKNPSKIRLGG